jgi:monomeric type NADP-dependent isocitrate dehydrogenase
MSAEQPTIIYTLTDEAPMLATYAFLPIIRTFTEPAGINVESSDISVAARILAEFSDQLTEEQRVADNLATLGELTHKPDTNIIKLPNISASVPQLLAAIKELRAKDTTCPTTRASRRTTRKNRSRSVTPRFSAAPSTPYCGKVIRTVARQRRSRSTPASIRTAWASGHRRRVPTSRP